MNKWLVTIAFLMCFMPPVLSLDLKGDEEKFQASQRISRVWKAIESVELADRKQLIPHAILYGGGNEMDVFVTFSKGLFKFVTPEVEAPKTHLPWYWNCYNYGSHILNWNFFSWYYPRSSRFYTHDIDHPYTNSSSQSEAFIAKSWNCDDSKGIKKIYACDESAVFRVSFGTTHQAPPSFLDYEPSVEVLTAYIEKSLNAGIKIACPTGCAQKVDWRISSEIIPYLVKYQDYKYIKYVTRPQYKIFQSAVEECRKERASK